jgi:hypothetical protein
MFDQGMFDDEDDWDEFFAQMCMIKMKHGADKIEDLETKKELKTREGVSPDRADSWAMMHATQAPEMPMSFDVPELAGGEVEEMYDGRLTA